MNKTPLQLPLEDVVPYSEGPTRAGHFYFKINTTGAVIRLTLTPAAGSFLKSLIYSRMWFSKEFEVRDEPPLPV